MLPPNNSSSPLFDTNKVTERQELSATVQSLLRALSARQLSVPDASPQSTEKSSEQDFLESRSPQSSTSSRLSSTPAINSDVASLTKPISSMPAPLIRGMPIQDRSACWATAAGSQSYKSEAPAFQAWQLPHRHASAIFRNSSGPILRHQTPVIVNNALVKALIESKLLPGGTTLEFAQQVCDFADAWPQTFPAHSHTSGVSGSEKTCFFVAHLKLLIEVILSKAAAKNQLPFIADLLSQQLLNTRARFGDGLMPMLQPLELRSASVYEQNFDEGQPLRLRSYSHSARTPTTASLVLPEELRPRETCVERNVDTQALPPSSRFIWMSMYALRSFKEAGLTPERIDRHISERPAAMRQSMALMRSALNAGLTPELINRFSAGSDAMLILEYVANHGEAMKNTCGFSPGIIAGLSIARFRHSDNLNRDEIQRLVTIVSPRGSNENQLDQFLSFARAANRFWPTFQQLGVSYQNLVETLAPTRDPEAQLTSLFHVLNSRTDKEKQAERTEMPAPRSSSFRTMADSVIVSISAQIFQVTSPTISKSTRTEASRASKPFAMSSALFSETIQSARPVMRARFE